MTVLSRNSCLGTIRVAVCGLSTAAYKAKPYSYVIPAADALPKPLLNHLMSCNYLKKETQAGNLPERYCLNYLGRLLFKNLKLEWRKFVTETEYMNPINDANWMNVHIGDEQYCKSDIWIRLNELLESHDRAVTLICDVPGTVMHIQHIITAEKMQSQRSEASEVELQHLEFLKHLYNHPLRLKMMKLPSGERKSTYNAGNNSFQIHDTKLLSTIDGLGRNCRKCALQTMVTSVNLHEVLLSILTDGSMERNGLPYLLFHRCLIPIKVMVLCETSSDHHDVSQLADELCDMVTSWDMACLNGTQQGLTVENADAIGCLFTIIVKESFLQDGLLFLRSISTTLSSQVHVTRLYQFLWRYTNYEYTDGRLENQHTDKAASR